MQNFKIGDIIETTFENKNVIAGIIKSNIYETYEEDVEIDEDVFGNSVILGISKTYNVVLLEKNYPKIIFQVDTSQMKLIKHTNNIQMVSFLNDQFNYKIDQKIKIHVNKQFYKDYKKWFYCSYKTFLTFFNYGINYNYILKIKQYNNISIYQIENLTCQPDFFFGFQINPTFYISENLIDMYKIY